MSVVPLSSLLVSLSLIQRSVLDMAVLFRDYECSKMNKGEERCAKGEERCA